MLPADDAAGAVEPGAQPMHEGRPIVAAGNVVLAAEHHPNRGAAAERLGDGDSLGDHGLRGAAAKAAAGECRVDLDLLGFEPADLRGKALIERLHLRARPDAAAVRRNLDHAVQRLHRRVRQIGKFVVGGERFGGAGNRALRIAVAAQRRAGLFAQRTVRGEDVGAAARFGGRIVPLDLERVAALLGRPEAAADHRHHAGAGRDLDHALDGARGAVVDALEPRAKARRSRHQRGQHARALDVERVLRAAVDLRPGVDARQALADQRECRRLFQRHAPWHELTRRFGGEGAESAALARARMGENAVADLDVACRHLPFRGSRLNEHQPRHGAGLAHLPGRVGDRRRVAGTLHLPPEQIVVARDVGGRRFHPDLRPVGVELFGQQRGEPGVNALAELEMF